MLAYGAAITSLGLALATWVSRLGRAIALCVTAYVGLVIGWPDAGDLCLRGLDGSRHQALVLGDPPYGAAFLTMAASASGGSQIAGEADARGRLPLRVRLARGLHRRRGVAVPGHAGHVRPLPGPDPRGRPPPGRRAEPRRSSLSPDELLALVPSASEG